MPYSPFYRRRPYRMISYGVSPWTEMARWVMDRLQVQYREESHVPLLHFLFSRNSTDVLPGLVVPERRLDNAREVLTYWNAHGPLHERLVPSSDAGFAALFERLYGVTGLAARRWAYYYILGNRQVTLRCWHAGAPSWEKIVSSILFPLMRLIMKKGLKLTSAAPQEALAEIDDCFRMIGERLGDGRRYLMGDRLTAVDIVFASLLGPVVLPEGYGGALPTLDEAPLAMRREVTRLRETPAGRFILRLYLQDRGRPSRDGIPMETGIKARVAQLFLAISGNPRVLRVAFGLLRRFRPVLILGKTVVVARYADVVDVLQRDEEFTLSQINEKRMDEAHAPFILGWDRSPRYEREVGILRRALTPAELAPLRALVVRHASDCIAAAAGFGRLDVVSGLARIVPTRVVAEFFGTPGPNEQTLMRWMRTLFRQLFLNRSNDPKVSPAAARCADQLRDYLTALIADRQQNPDLGTNDILSRLLHMQRESGDSFDDDAVRRNISGLIVGAVDTTSAAVAQAIDQLLDFPAEFRLATQAARAGDVGTVAKYVFEALRFNPQTAGLIRFCSDGAAIGERPHARRLPPQTTVVLATLSAMFDERVFREPSGFDINRNSARYLHFGDGMHTCFGRVLNEIQIPQIALALLALKGLRRAAGSAGRAVYDGPFPDRLLVEFDP